MVADYRLTPVGVSFRVTHYRLKPVVSDEQRDCLSIDTVYGLRLRVTGRFR